MNTKKITTQNSNNVADIYKMKTLKQHIIDLPDTYIGSIQETEYEMWVYNTEENKMEFRKVLIYPGLYKIFDEIIVNAYDQHARLKETPNKNQVKEIHVTINEENGEISVMNDGEGIDIEIHPEHNIYIPEMIFGNLLTSANYEKMNKTTGGKNGYGAKLTNIYSTKFILETVDGIRKKYYKQVFENNMDNKSEPIIEPYSKKPFTKITFIPDYNRFKIENISNDMIALMKKRVYDMTACTDKSVTVYLNEQKLEFKDFEKYCDLYIGPKSETKRSYEEVNERWEVCVSLSPDDKFEQVSFVNGIYTFKGGQHVDYVADSIASKLVKFVENKKSKSKINIKPSHIKDNMFIILRSIIEDPGFDSQTKEYLNTPPKGFGSKCIVSDKFIEKLSKCGIVEKAIALSEYKETNSLKKTDGKKQNVLRIPKLDDANDAGTDKSGDCTLILTEGDSAKALAIAGLSIVGRSKYGVFPLKGKPLNVREAKTEQILKNEEFTNLKKIIGLEQGKEYENTNSLRYGKGILIMTDQDLDGSHIKGLLINMLHAYWPSLLKVPGFLRAMKTPIVKAKKGKEIKVFYTLSEYENWKETIDIGQWDIKYYKGLGTSTANEGKEYFRELDKNEVEYLWSNDNTVDLVINLAFSKDKANERKEWLGNYDKNNIIQNDQKQVNLEDFINKDLIHFSKYDNERSVPSLVDGMKPSQRKVMYGALKRKLRKSMKVAQFAAYVAEHSSYHHGEASLTGTIIGMAQDYVGSNNINMLIPDGQFGTRLMGGEDHASPRYIFTYMNELSEILLNENDNALLNYLDEDGDKIEPEWYIPILPLVLVNGSVGIGTGFSTNIPCYNPKDLCTNLIKLMDGQELEDLVPWFRGFQGKIICEDGKYYSKGMFRVIDEGTVEIYELPIGMWTEKYVEFLDSLIMERGDKKGGQKERVLLNYEKYYTEKSVRFLLKFHKPLLAKVLSSGEFEKKFKLIDSKHTNTTNMHLFNKDGQIKKYNKPNDILKEFYELRLDYYVKRREYILNKLNREKQILDARVRFILGLISDQIILKNKDDEEIDNMLEKMNFPKFIKGQLEFQVEESNGKPSYDYLLSMPFKSLTKKRVDEMNKQYKEKTMEYNLMEAKTAKDLWRDDINRFINVWEKQLKEYEDDIDKTIKESGGKTTKKVVLKKKKVIE